MQHYISPTGVFTLDYPEEFKVSEANGVTFVQTSNNKSCLSVSTHQFDTHLPSQHFIALFQTLTAKYEAVQGPFYHNESLLLQRFKTVKPNEVGDIITTFWTVCMRRLEHNVVVVSINVDSSEDIKIYECYEKVLDSVLESI